MAAIKRVIWTGSATSDSRTDPSTGLRLEYRLTVYDTGEAECTCPAFVFQSLNNGRVAPADKLRFRCKHLVRAFAANDFAVQEAPAPVAPAPPPPAPPRPPATSEHGLWLDDDDDSPRVRR